MARSFFPPAQQTKVRRQIQQGLYMDWCEVIRPVSPGLDEYGSAIPPVMTTQEADSCFLHELGRQQGEERVVASRLSWSAGYAIDLKPETIASEEDTIRVNGNRIFEVSTVHRSGFNIATTAIVEERG